MKKNDEKTSYNLTEKILFTAYPDKRPIKVATCNLLKIASLKCFNDLNFLPDTFYSILALFHLESSQF